MNLGSKNIVKRGVTMKQSIIPAVKNSIKTAPNHGTIVIMGDHSMQLVLTDCLFCSPAELHSKCKHDDDNTGALHFLCVQAQ